jgi:hypothetical protein
VSDRHESPKVGLVTLIRGFNWARDRLAKTDLDADALEQAYMTVFEALNWAAAIDEECKHPEFKPLRGLHHVRNSVHHDLAQAIDFEPPRAYGEGSYGSGVYGGVSHWRWKPLRELPEPDQQVRRNRYFRANCESYEEVVAGRSVVHTLDELSEFFDTL